MKPVRTRCYSSTVDQNVTYLALVGYDYTMLSMNIRFPVGARHNDMECVDVSITDDNVLESNETFILELTSTDLSVLTIDNITVITITSEDGNIITILACIYNLTLYRGYYWPASC